MLNITVWTIDQLSNADQTALEAQLRETLPETLSPKLQVDFQLDGKVAPPRVRNFKGQIIVQTWSSRANECLTALAPFSQAGWWIGKDPQPDPYLPGAKPPDPG